MQTHHDYYTSNTNVSNKRKLILQKGLFQNVA